jgi:hypothetical protein
MRELTINGDSRMTRRQVAEATGAAYSTVAAYAQKAGWTRNGKITLLDDEQVTLIVEAMKTAKSSGAKSNLAFQMQGVETGKSRLLRMKILQEEMNALYEAEIRDLKAENRVLTARVESAENLLEQRTEGLEAIQRIAEAGGLLMSDRDDLYSAYRRLA